VNNQSQNWLNNIRKNPILFTQVKNLKKPTNLIGIAVILLSLVLLARLIFLKNQTKIQAISEVLTALPKGLFSYDGSPIFAPIVASGSDSLVEAKYPGFDLRYTKSPNGKVSIKNTIDRLIDGELTFIYSDRPLTDAEYQKAKLRSFSLASQPIALDATVVYSTTKIPVSGLSQKQIKKIFRGELTNWRQINPRINLPITPVVVKNETTPGIEVKTTPKIQYTDNYTLALRKVIATPGAISFASASILQEQLLIKMFAIDNYPDQIKPWVDGRLNKEAFRDASYPLTRRIYLVYRIDGSTDQKAAEAYAQFLRSAEGQRIIERAGFVSIY
jgi:phosphate transport system substrate-binding protein